ncbi:MAG: cobalamin-binding protein [Nitrospirae bacterium]|nr:MAG: cobalamin-binding protein [Nitrospirota bacterium]
MRICSLLPGATEVVAALGLSDDLVAISHECDYPPEIRPKPVVIKSAVDPRRTSSPAIDRQVREAMQNGNGLYRIDESLLNSMRPDLIITQSLCDVCAVTPTEVQRAIAGLAQKPRILSLDPTNLEGVLHDIEAIGSATGRDEQARHLVQSLRDRIAGVQALVQGAPPRRTACIEWLEPLYCAGHWVPEMVTLAGGVDRLATAGAPSVRITWEQVVDAAPDVLVLMPCGFSIDRTCSESDLLTSRPGWNGLPAVANNQVYAVEGAAYFNRSGPRLVDGVELLAALFHPSRFGNRLPEGARRI